MSRTHPETRTYPLQRKFGCKITIFFTNIQICTNYLCSKNTKAVANWLCRGGGVDFLGREGRAWQARSGDTSRVEAFRNLF